jgi:hypothetical protein
MLPSKAWLSPKKSHTGCRIEGTSTPEITFSNLVHFNKMKNKNQHTQEAQQKLFEVEKETRCIYEMKGYVHLSIKAKLDGAWLVE